VIIGTRTRIFNPDLDGESEPYRSFAAKNIARRLPQMADVAAQQSYMIATAQVGKRSRFQYGASKIRRALGAMMSGPFAMCGSTFCSPERDANDTRVMWLIMRSCNDE